MIPIETISPVMPARSKLGATEVCPSAEMIAHSIIAVSTSPEITTRPSAR